MCVNVFYFLKQNVAVVWQFLKISCFVGKMFVKDFCADFNANRTPAVAAVGRAQIYGQKDGRTDGRTDIT
jgi:hypothetical protein